MTLLNVSQQAFVKSYRMGLWTRPFYVLDYTSTVASGGYYSDVAPAPTRQLLSGDWVWRDQHELRGKPGGVVDQADLIVNIDLLYSGALITSPGGKKRLMVDGVECAITALSPYVESGELVITAVRVKV